MVHSSGYLFQATPEAGVEFLGTQFRVSQSGTKHFTGPLFDNLCRLVLKDTMKDTQKQQRKLVPALETDLTGDVAQAHRFARIEDSLRCSSVSLNWRMGTQQPEAFARQMRLQGGGDFCVFFLSISQVTAPKGWGEKAIANFTQRAGISSLKANLLCFCFFLFVHLDLWPQTVSCLFPGLLGN